jgi:hypothetical protein
MSEIEGSAVDAGASDPSRDRGRLENRLLREIGNEIGLLGAQFLSGMLSPRKFLIEVEVRCANMRAVLDNLGVRQSLARAETLILRETLADCAGLLAQTTERLKDVLGGQTRDPGAPEPSGNLEEDEC